MNELLKMENISKTFVLGKGFISESGKRIDALKNINLNLNKGRCLGIAGESGSGKTTLGRVIMRLISADSGSIYFDGRDINTINRREYARCIQMVFQDPYSSLNPKMSIGDMLIEALKISGWELELNRKAYIEKARFLLYTVGIPENALWLYPHQFSGGQRQRIAIARALALKPRVLIADEILSALDVSVQAQMLNLLAELKEKFEMSYIFITHDLAVLSVLSDDVAVMRAGEVVEFGSCDRVLFDPSTDYTKGLINALPKLPV